mmetsp:Transcript_39819/g.100995  ORF Transcript_39819/g.100995 Transcript_39819/m.100995 type:complete len:350 (+) Transcript_39819:258-1307(+)
MRCSSAAGVAFLSVSSASLAPSPMVPPTKIFTPSTPFPSSLAAAPISPMSPTCACPHELGHPVQFKRTILGMSSCFSSSAATWMARFFVSTIPKPQNWEPVQDTSPREMLPGLLGNFAHMGSARKASTSASLTSVKMMFWSTVRRILPPLYFSARSATSRQSWALMRPAGTHRPTQFRPSCRCLCTPSRSRRSQWSPYSSGTASAMVTPIFFSISSLSLGTPQSSRKYIMRVFWRTSREPLSRNSSSKALQKGTIWSGVTDIWPSTETTFRTALNMPPSHTLKTTSPLSGCLMAWKARSLMWQWGKSSREGEMAMLNFRGRLHSSGLPLPKLVIMSCVSMQIWRTSMSS